MTGTQGGQTEGRQEREDQTEGFVDQAADTARKVYDEGGRYLRERWNSLPDMDQYVSRPVQENPLISIAVAGAVGYLLAYLIHGRDSHSSRSGVPDSGPMRDHGRSGKTTLQRNAEKALRMKREAGPEARIPEHHTAHEGGVRGSQVNYSDTAVGKEPTYTPNLKRSRVARSGDA